MKTKAVIKDYIPLLMFFTCVVTLFPFFHVFIDAWDELNYGIVLGLLGLQLFCSIFFTILIKKHIALRMIVSILFTAIVLGVVFAIPIYYLNSVFTIGATYASVVSITPVVLLFAINAAVRLCAKGEAKKRPVIRAAGLVLCIALAVIPFGKYLTAQKTADSVGVYCHNANQVICVQNLLIHCGEHAVQLNDSENSPYRGGNRVYANLISGSRGISVGDESSVSDYNVFASALDSDAMQLNITKKAYSLEEWQDMGFDKGSVCVPFTVTLNPQTLLLTVSGVDTLPVMPVVKEFMPGVIGSDELTYDFFAAERKDGAFGVGAFETLPADGAAISIDPRCGK